MRFVVSDFLERIFLKIDISSLLTLLQSFFLIFLFTLISSSSYLRNFPFLSLGFLETAIYYFLYFTSEVFPLRCFFSRYFCIFSILYYNVRVPIRFVDAVIIYSMIFYDLYLLESSLSSF